MEKTTVPNQRPALARAPTYPEVSQPARIGGSENGRSNSSPVPRRAPTVQVTLPPPKEYREQKSDRDFVSFMDAVRTEQSPIAALQPERGKPQPRRMSRAL